MNVAATPVPPPPVPPVLTDGTVTLRAHRAGDAEAVLRQSHDPDTIRFTRVPTPYTLDAADAFLADRPREWASGESYAFAVDDAGGFAGSVDLRPRSGGRAEVGFGLGPWARGRGTMSRALRLILPWGFEALSLHVVHWQAVTGNWPSRRAAWSVGFRVEGTISGWLDDRDGECLDAWVGSLRSTDPLEPAHPWFSPPLIRGSRVVLRPHRESDLARIVEAASDTETARFLPMVPQPYSEGDARAHLDHVAEEQATGRALYWVVADPDDDRLLGQVALHRLDGGAAQHEIGYLTHPEARHRGLTTSAVQLAARHALMPAAEGGLGLPRLALRADVDNIASQRVALRAGFSRCGVERAAARRGDGRLHDQVTFDILPTDIAVPPDDLPHLPHPPNLPDPPNLPGGAAT